MRSLRLPHALGGSEYAKKLGRDAAPSASSGAPIPRSPYLHLRLLKRVRGALLHFQVKTLHQPDTDGAVSLPKERTIRLHTCYPVFSIYSVLPIKICEESTFFEKMCPNYGCYSVVGESAGFYSPPLATGKCDGEGRYSLLEEKIYLKYI
jgi:hypothetical protein